jgi:hypothetical protein
MRISPRLRSTVRSALLAIIGVFASSWLLLYLDSLHERRRAEHLIADLKSFPFATAGFPEVRELANRYGGTAVQSFPLLQFLPPGPPLNRFPGSTDSHEEVLAPNVRILPTCTPQDCIFEIRIMPHVVSWAFNRKAETLLWSGVAHIGLRPWAVGARYEVKNGTLWKSSTWAAQERHAKSGSYEGLIPLGYQVISLSQANALDRPRSEYAVGVPHVTGTVSDGLQAWFVQVPNAPIKRAFDIHTYCLTAVLHSCSGFADLAPTAWADYQAELKRDRDGIP